jgi:hypothetical protein
MTKAEFEAKFQTLLGPLILEMRAMGITKIEVTATDAAASIADMVFHRSVEMPRLEPAPDDPAKRMQWCRDW